MTLRRVSVGTIVAALAATIAFHPVLGARTPKTQPVVIEIRKFEFVPKTVRINPGDVVVWKNMDIVPHTATASGGSWDTGSLARSETGNVEFSEPGRINYICAFHPHMTGEIIVVESDDLDS